MRQIVLDTETTGLEPSEGHRIIEIGCVELVNRRLTGNNFHQYVNPEREVDAGAIEVHGITNEMLADKPKFADVARDFLEYVKEAELVIHNAPFDVGFLNHELAQMGERVKIDKRCAIVDTLLLARQKHPGQKNDLDSLCRRYSVDNGHRTLHGALLDAEILADVYLAMTGGQTGLFEDSTSRGDKATGATATSGIEVRRLPADRQRLLVVAPSAAEAAAHADWIAELDRKCGGQCIWKKQDNTSS
jgi:DNA polymerase-3 subunit epsilon